MSTSLVPTVLGPSIAFSVTAVDPLVLSLNLPLISRALAVPPQLIGFLGGTATPVVTSAALAVLTVGGL
ncbi:hypothetical protein ACFSL4_12520 [Streptomyces caeni]|uniref:MFS transporter n=1 Tax=Streptomyces caeni TaxID=2307231 RepID=A0ABW4IPZ7_9ACTN